MTARRCRSSGAACSGATSSWLLRTEWAPGRIVGRPGVDAVIVRRLSNAGSMVHGEASCRRFALRAHCSPKLRGLVLHAGERE